MSELTNLPERWREIAKLEAELEAVIDGDLTSGMNLTWSAAERCVVLMYRIHRAAQREDVREEFAATLAKVLRGAKDPIEKLVRHEMAALPPAMKYKVIGVQSQIVAALHLIDREIGDDDLPSDEALVLFINDVCGGLEKCRLKWLHLIADEMRKKRAAEGGAPKPRKTPEPAPATPPVLPADFQIDAGKLVMSSAIEVVRKAHPDWPDLKIEGYAQALLDAPAPWLAEMPELEDVT